MRKFGQTIVHYWQVDLFTWESMQCRSTLLNDIENHCFNVSATSASFKCQLDFLKNKSPLSTSFASCKLLIRRRVYDSKRHIEIRVKFALTSCSEIL